MTPAEYRARWKLPLDYPMLAPNYRFDREQAWRDKVRTARRAKARKAPADAR
jgi:predicted transcriptional regulator